MRVRIYRDGRPDWSDNEPANGCSGPFRPSGSLVVSGPDWRERQRGPGAREREYAAKRERRAKEREA